MKVKLVSKENKNMKKYKIVQLSYVPISICPKTCDYIYIIIYSDFVCVTRGTVGYKQLFTGYIRVLKKKDNNIVILIR